MKRLVVKHPENCLACGRCAKACAKAWYKTEDDDLACIRVTIGRRGPQISVCDQCGACAAACPLEAVAANSRGVFMVDKSVCLACLACMDACPGDLIVKADEKQTVTKCTACGLCVKACPAAVLAIEEVTEAPQTSR